MRRFTILHVDGERGLRGGERQLLYLAGALRARGHRNLICARRGGELAEQASRRGFEVMRLPFLTEYDPCSAAALAAAAAGRDFVVHAHTAHAAGIAALSSLAGARVVMHRRVDFGVSRWSASWKYGRAGKVVAVSRAIAGIMEEAGVPKEKLAVVTDAIPVNDDEARWVGLDTTPFQPPTENERTDHRRILARELGIDPAMRLIGNLAALVPHKDHDTLIAAALLVCLKRPEARFVIAGRGPEEARLFGSLQRMGLVGKVVLAGHRPDPLPLLKSLDVYCQSSWGEGMGSVLLEAAACGLPVAATTAGGIPEAVEDGVTGLLVPPRDPEALAGALLRLLGDDALRRRLGEAARARAARFGLGAAAESMERVYEAVA